MGRSKSLTIVAKSYGCARKNLYLAMLFFVSKEGTCHNLLHGGFLGTAVRFESRVTGRIADLKISVHRRNPPDRSPQRLQR